MGVPTSRPCHKEDDQRVRAIRSSPPMRSTPAPLHPPPCTAAPPGLPVPHTGICGETVADPVRHQSCSLRYSSVPGGRTPVRERTACTAMRTPVAAHRDPRPCRAHPGRWRRAPPTPRRAAVSIVDLPLTPPPSRSRSAPPSPGPTPGSAAYGDRQRRHVRFQRAGAGGQLQPHLRCRGRPLRLPDPSPDDRHRHRCRGRGCGWDDEADQPRRRDRATPAAADGQDAQGGGAEPARYRGPAWARWRWPSGAAVWHCSQDLRRWCSGPGPSWRIAAAERCPR